MASSGQYGTHKAQPTQRSSFTEIISESSLRSLLQPPEKRLAGGRR
jgi:hypothetical protein